MLSFFTLKMLTKSKSYRIRLAITYFSFLTPRAFQKGMIYTSTIKSPSAVQMSKSIKQTQSVDKVYYNTRV